jgi:hypothetical protein
MHNRQAVQRATAGAWLLGAFARIRPCIAPHSGEMPVPARLTRTLLLKLAPRRMHCSGVCVGAPAGGLSRAPQLVSEWRRWPAGPRSEGLLPVVASAWLLCMAPGLLRGAPGLCLLRAGVLAWGLQASMMLLPPPAKPPACGAACGRISSCAQRLCCGRPPASGACCRWGCWFPRPAPCTTRLAPAVEAQALLTAAHGWHAWPGGLCSAHDRLRSAHAVAGRAGMPMRAEVCPAAAQPPWPAAVLGRAGLLLLLLLPHGPHGAGAAGILLQPALLWPPACRVARMSPARSRLSTSRRATSSCASASMSLQLCSSSCSCGGGGQRS